ncbi:MAG TPA: FAD-dependent oxidoreductase [Rhizomicrobium sp.]|nr:FAD-dependent oxidoreductase [Rhizomicrobium sp.]
MDRREFLAASVLAALETASSAAASLPDVVVIGAGAFGGWTALVLRERGYKVTLLDAYGVGNSRASSGDESRHLRAGYEDRDLYSEWAFQAMAEWKHREQEFGRSLMYPSVRLQMAASMNKGLSAQRVIFDRLNIPYEIADQAQLRRRYPQINFDDVNLAFIETPASSAVLKARESTLAVAERLITKGGTVQVAQARPGASAGRTLTDLDLGQNGRIAAGLFIFACGPWLPKIFPQFLGRKISSPRRELYYWGVPAGDTRFNWPNLPTWSDDTVGNYGFPNFDRGVKVAPPHAGLFQQDPDEDERVPSAYLMRRAREWVAHRFPGMAEMPIVESRICQVETTANGDFIIDHHPDFDNVWIVGGGSGHGFKHGPLVGRYVADRVSGKAGDPEAARLFALAGRGDI